MVGLDLHAQVVDRELKVKSVSLQLPQNPWDTSRHYIYICPSSSTISKPLYILNGKEISASDFSKLDVKLILSNVVIKDADTEKKYGDKAKDGILIITTPTL